MTARRARPIDVYLEIGAKKAFAAAVDWPGWSRSGRDEEAALQALVEYGPRYARAIKRADRTFRFPAGIDELRVTERLKGDATTDFGAPGAVPAVDDDALTPAELKRLEAILRSCWRAFEEAAASAADAELRPGPRGGGRSVAKMREHVVGAERSYAHQVGATGGLGQGWPDVQAGFIGALRGRARGELPDTGPRGGRRWPARYGVRRASWHVLDHAWEIEDRSTSQD